MFHEFTGHQATFAERERDRVIQAVHFLDGGALAVDVEHGRHFRLHAIGELVGIQPGLQVRISKVVFQVFLVQAAQQFPLGLPGLRAQTLGWLQVSYGLSLPAEHRALVSRRKKAAAPLLGAAERNRAEVGQGHVGRQVLVLRQTESQPGAQ